MVLFFNKMIPKTMPFLSTQGIESGTTLSKNLQIFYNPLKINNFYTCTLQLKKCIENTMGMPLNHIFIHHETSVSWLGCCTSIF